MKSVPKRLSFVKSLLQRATEAAAEGIAEVLHEGKILLDEDEQQQFWMLFAERANQTVPRAIKSIVLFALLAPLIKRDIGFFRKRDVSEEEAEMLAQTTAEKLLEELASKLPRGNIGAWRSQIRLNVFYDFCRRRRLERQHLQRLNEQVEFPVKCDPIGEEEALEDIRARCSTEEKAIIEQALNGARWEADGKMGSISRAEQKKIVQRLWPGRSSPSRRRRSRT